MWASDAIFKRVVQVGWVALMVGVGCTRKSDPVPVPAGAGGSPTSTPAPGSDLDEGKGQRGEAPPDIPFDGGKPEALGIPTPQKSNPDSPSGTAPAPQPNSGTADGTSPTATDSSSPGGAGKIRDIYTQLLSGSLSCAEDKK